MEISKSDILNVIRTQPTAIKKIAGDEVLPKDSSSLTKLPVEILSKVIDSVQRFVKDTKTSLEFVSDQELKLIITKVLDSEGEEIRQIPPEEMVKIMKTLRKGTGLVDLVG